MMRFRDWLQNEIQLNLGKVNGATNPLASAVKPNQIAQATQGVAQNAMSTFGPQIVQDMSAAPNPAKAGMVAVNYAQKTMGKPGQPNKTPTNALAVGGEIYKQATGQDMKTMGKK